MFSLPIIFLCNTVLFGFVMKERFKAVTTLVGSGVAYLLSIISNAAVSNMFADPVTAGMVGNSICVFWLLLVSVFIASNNILQKIFLSLLLVTNYSFITGFVPLLLGVIPLGTAGITSVLMSNLIYVALSFLTFVFIGRPMEYFFRQGISYTMGGLCILQFLAYKTSGGFIADLVGVKSFSLDFFATLFLYVIIFFTLRSCYESARFKERDMALTARGTLIDVQAENFNSMRTNVEAIKTIKRNVDYIFGKIGILADAGRPEEISKYVHTALSRNNQGAIIGHYSEDSHINAIVATKTAEALERGIELTSDIVLGETKIKTLELAIIINELLASVMNQCESVEDGKYIKLSVLPTETQLTVEAVYTANKKHMPKLHQGTLQNIAHYLFSVQEDDQADITNIKEIVKKYSGKITVLNADNETITRIGINY